MTDNPEYQPEQPAQPPTWPQGDATPPPPPPPPPAPPAPYAGPMPPQQSSNAIIALVLAIVSWVVCPVIPAIIALVYANKADAEIAANPARITGQGMSTAAKIVSWINIGLYAALIVIGIIVFGIALAAGGLSGNWN